MHTLHIFRGTPWQFRYDDLIVDFDSVNNRFDMTYFDGGRRAWTRRVPPDRAVATLERFLFHTARWLMRTDGC